MERLTTDQIDSLYRQHHERMVLTARTLLGNGDEARDVVNDVFADLLVRNKPLDDAQAESYLMVSVRNRCLNLIEHQRVVRQSASEISSDGDASEEGEYEEPPVDDVLNYVSSALTPKSQQVIEQHFLKQKKYQDIAHDMGISRFAVYKHMTRGIRQLQAHFAWYHLVVALVLLSGAVFAVWMHFSRPAQPQPMAPTTAVQPATPTAEPRTIRYENATLEQILTDITKYNKVELRFLNDAPRQLRLHYDWHQAEPVADIAATLDAFDDISMELRDNTLYVNKP